MKRIPASQRCTPARQTWVAYRPCALSCATRQHVYICAYLKTTREPRQKRAPQPVPARAPLGGNPSADSKFIPQHVAVVMDGNGRWAGERSLPVTWRRGGTAGRCCGRYRKWAFRAAAYVLHRKLEAHPAKLRSDQFLHRGATASVEAQDLVRIHAGLVAAPQAVGRTLSRSSEHLSAGSGLPHHVHGGPREIAAVANSPISPAAIKYRTRPTARR